MGIIILIIVIFWIALQPGERRKPVNKKKLHAARIQEAHKILKGDTHGTIN